MSELRGPRILVPHDVEGAGLPLKETLYLSFLSCLSIDVNRALRRIAIIDRRLPDGEMAKAYAFSVKLHRLFRHLVSRQLD